MGTLTRTLVPLQNSLRSVSKLFLSRGLRTSSVCSSGRRKVPSVEEEAVVMSDDGRVIVCWHPEVPVPYELTKPIPTEAMPTDSLLKVQALRPAKELFRKKNQQMVLDELMQLTHTSKYAWLPKRRRLRYKEMDPLKEKRDRDYL